MKPVSLNEYKQYLEEKISSKQVEQELIGEFKKQVNRQDQKPKTHILFRNAVRSVLEQYIDDNDVEVWTKSQQASNPETYAQFVFHTNKTTGEVRKVGIRLFVPKDIVHSVNMTFEYLKKVATHELIHAVQFANSDFKSFNPGESQPNNFKEYLSLKEEVEAWAAEAVQDILEYSKRENLDNKLIIKNIGQAKITRLMAQSSNSFKTYYLKFRNSQEEGDQEVWRRFLKKFIQHFKERADIDSEDPLNKAERKGRSRMNRRRLQRGQNDRKY